MKMGKGENRGKTEECGFDVDQLWIWCFVCAAITPRSDSKMRKAFWRALLG